MADVIFEAPQSSFRRFVDLGDGTHAERVEARPPSKFITDGDGDYARIRVDAGQTGFFAGREGYTFHKFSILSGASQVIKVVSSVDSILQMFGANLNLASLDIELVSGGTEGGSFSTPLPVLRTNQMSTASDYALTTTMAVGGTHTGGTTLNILQLRAGSPATQAMEQTASNDLPYGFPAGIYYIKLINVDGATADGVFRARWEERP